MFLNFPQRMIRIANKIRWLIILLVLLIIKLFPQEGINYSQIYFLLIVAVIYNILVKLIPWQERWKDGKGQQICYTESILDVVFITGIIYLTGGLQSNFFLLYFVVVIFAATYFKPAKSWLLTICISLIYILIGLLSESPHSTFLSILLSRIPILFAITGISIYLLSEIKSQSEELEVEKEKLHNILLTLNENLIEIEKKNTILNEIYNLSLKIGSSLSLEEQLDIIIDVTNKFLNSNLTVISLFDERKMELKFKASKGDLLPGILCRDNVGIKESLLGKVIESGEPLIINDLNHPEFKTHTSLSNQKISSLLSVPLKIKEKIIGVFTCAYSQAMEFKEDQLKFLTLIASRSALSINNAQLHEEIKKLAITDGLTGLYNYRYFCENLRREIAICKRLNLSLSFLMIDIDYFKNVNDTYGHLEGDNILQKLGMFLRFQLRVSDMVARYGGEEFIIIAPGICKEKAFLMGERIRKEVEERLFTPEDKTRLALISPLTISIGISTFPCDTLEQEKLIEYADNALYEAKKTGRNRVVEYK